jgi:hypothetical protein
LGEPSHSQWGLWALNRRSLIASRRVATPRCDERTTWFHTPPGSEGLAAFHGETDKLPFGEGPRFPSSFVQKISTVTGK